MLTNKREEEISFTMAHIFYFFNFFNFDFFTIKKLQVLGEKWEKNVFCSISHNTDYFLIKFRLQMCHAILLIWLKNKNFKAQEHGQNCDVPPSPCPSQHRSPLLGSLHSLSFKPIELYKSILDVRLTWFSIGMVFTVSCLIQGQ